MMRDTGHREIDRAARPGGRIAMTAPNAQTIHSLSVLIPVYNSEKTLFDLVNQVFDVLSPHFDRLEVILVNDGSADNSHGEACRCLAVHGDRITYVRLARNFGEHNAVMCGLHHVKTDAVAIIDDDFQNPPGEILALTRRLAEGNFDVVYSRYAQKQHGPLRNLGSRFNDWAATQLLKKPRGLYLSSFKVLNRFLVGVVTTYEGPYPYLDGLILRSTNAIGVQDCAHHPRAAGRSNYTITKLVSLWLNMFTSFSITPLRISTYVGFAMSCVGILLAIIFFISYFLEVHYFLLNIPAGWASIIVTLCMFGGMQLCMLGMIGEYLGRLFLSSNRHPQFVIREVQRGSTEAAPHD